MSANPGAAPPAKSGSDFAWRMVAVGAGGALGVIAYANFLQAESIKNFGAGWLEPACAAVGAMLGLILDNALRGGKEASKS
jgi:hypothetical protein